MKEVSTYINGKETLKEWGLGFTEGAVAALMTPTPMKGYITNGSAIQNGCTVIRRTPKTDERELLLGFYIKGSSLADFFMKYERFCKELSKGFIDLNVLITDGDTYVSTTYHLLYMSCSKYTEFNGKLALFKLRMMEPNPCDITRSCSGDIQI